MKKVSVIVPIYNEGEAVRSFLNDLIKEVGKLKYQSEILVFDSPTSKNSEKVLREFAKKYPNVKGYEVRHPGVTVTDKTNKYMLGIQLAQGDYIITSDGDGQDRPEEFHKFFQALEEGYDFAIGRKKKRRDGLAYMITSRIANFIVRSITGVKVHDMNNGIKAFRKDIARELNLKAGHFRFIPVIAAAKKWKITEIDVEHRERLGKGRFSFMSRLQGGLFDMLIVYFITKMGDTPMYLLGWFSLIMKLFAFVFLLLGLFGKGEVFYILSLMIFLFSINTFLSALLMEYQRTSYERKDYSSLIVEKIGS
ncbi:MAG: Glycosyl transferase family 2 [candidate division WS6 bacterium GW2011_GWF2_39_15]|uniref:Glycosyl transferase family 2 n=1 Tax=candidate division WS6 bacterium GW2011_GWF2_39_15 TaxID=1619100 RepID=A0A0G0MZQ2_9BACT|nr:MAG: Glycosyl transferase family 2 [candidate division WS6 bacterium GW2011_GWF2_39_15]